MRRASHDRVTTQFEAPARPLIRPVACRNGIGWNNDSEQGTRRPEVRFGRSFEAVTPAGLLDAIAKRIGRHYADVPAGRSLLTPFAYAGGSGAVRAMNSTSQPIQRN